MLASYNHGSFQAQHTVVHVSWSAVSKCLYALYFLSGENLARATCCLLSLRKQGASFMTSGVF